jgi:hypothetical protein
LRRECREKYTATCMKSGTKNTWLFYLPVNLFFKKVNNSVDYIENPLNDKKGIEFASY